MGIVQMLVRFISILCTLPFLAAETSEPSVPQLLEEYIARGNAPPNGCIYWNEICPGCGNEDKFTGSYLTNPIADIMDKIAMNAHDPLEFHEG